MRDKYSKTHAEIAREIRLAKKRMFRAHCEGAPLPQAADQFVAEVAAQIARQSERLGVAEITNAENDHTEKPVNRYASDLEKFGVTDSDLEAFADYFARAFNFDTEPVTVLIGLIQRLAALANPEEPNTIGLPDVAWRFSHRLFARCDECESAASKFADDASDAAKAILEERRSA